ncbi:hypothetical protein FQZ97_1221330 [compost metagenome]
MSGKPRGAAKTHNGERFKSNKGALARRNRQMAMAIEDTRPNGPTAISSRTL